MPYILSDKVRIDYEEKGDGTPLVFLHGFSLDRRMWDDQVRYFSPKFHTIIYDARGHGRSDSPETGYSREDREEDLLQLLDHLKLSRVHLVGLSMGGGDALAFAIDHQDRLISLIMADAAASGFQPRVRFHDFGGLLSDKGVEEVKRQYIESTLSYYVDRDQDIRQRLATMMQDFSGKMWLDPMANSYAEREDVRLSASVRIPTLIIAGKKDIAWLPLASKLNEIMLDSELAVIPGAGHMSNMEAPAEFNSIVDQFLTRVEQSVSRIGGEQ